MPTGLLSLHNAPGLFVPIGQLPDLIITTLVFAVVGIILFALAFWVVSMLTPFSIRKEIEEDQNSALAIIIAALIIGIAIIVGAAVHG
ncbi:MAG TPA: DUF350 domain-containing protein [Blastocatellia bacterium]|nr:DUF350 domain-containing protein [Blastocatellia bacterium]